MRRRQVAALTALGMVVMLAAGCRVEENKHGDSKDVQISIPFGGMHVKTNNADVAGSIGLAAYPGAQAVNDDGDDNRSADVDMSFGGFRLRVKEAKYRTGDSMEKVEAFYRGEMKRFGDVIACRDDHTVGTPAKTLEGLTCDSSHNAHVTVDDHEGNNKLELKAGSKQYQHIVEIEPDGSGTKFGLVALDLPKSNDDDGN